MNDLIFQVPATITQLKTMADRSLRLQVDTDRELSPEENALLFSLNNISGYFIFKAGEIEQEDLINLPEEKVEFKDQKSPSQILRNRMFIYYKEKKGTTEGFEEFRKKEMLRLGQMYLDKLK